jgi:hypothetical protein
MDEMMHTSHRKEPRNLSRESSHIMNNVQVVVQGPDIPVHHGPNILAPTIFFETARIQQYIVDRVNYLQD